MLAHALVLVDSSIAPGRRDEAFAKVTIVLAAAQRLGTLIRARPASRRDSRIVGE
ncbi:MAG TPA: hypothetical protein VLF19_07320 [Methylomirabilota bacterium]|nr:hypothetical protein [Methylomirabilota bacterium]